MQTTNLSKAGKCRNGDFSEGPALEYRCDLPVQLREFQTFDYKCPATWLRSLREVEPLVASSGLNYKVRSLRTRKLRRWNEIRQGALFAVGIAQRFPEYAVDIAHPGIENSPFDVVIRTIRPEGMFFTPVQLKELVPPACQQDACLDSILADLAKYRSLNLVVAIHLNRRLRFVPRRLSLPNLGGLYLFGAKQLDRSVWVLIGDLLRSSDVSVFAHP